MRLRCAEGAYLTHPIKLGVCCVCFLVLPNVCSATDLYVGNFFGNDSDVLKFNGTKGAFMDVFVASGSGGLSGGRDVTFGADGNLYATSSGTTGGVLKYNGTTGAFLGAFVGPGSELSLPRGLVFGPDGNLYVA